MRARSLSSLSWLLALCAPQVGCGAPPVPPDPLLVSRPFELRVPAGYDGSQPTPLVILLHSYTMSGERTSEYLRLGELVDERGFLYAYPDGIEDESGLRFWNATDGCCNLFGANVDDVAYLRAIIRDSKARYNVDPKRVYLVGHSNGGFMSFRMACEVADEIAALVSFAGGTWKDPGRCRQGAPVSVLDVHGDRDEVIRYEGGRFLNHPALADHPSARETVAQAAAHNGCRGALTDASQPLDLDTVLDGSETRVERYQGCPQDGAVELWTVRGGRHFPTLAKGWPRMVYDFLAAHPKP